MSDCDCPSDGSYSFEFCEPGPDCCGHVPTHCDLIVGFRALRLCWDGVNQRWATHAAMESDDVVTLSLTVGPLDFPPIAVAAAEAPELAAIFGSATQRT